MSISNIFAEVKREITIEAFLHSIGHDMKHYNGRTKLLCLFHSEKTPSMVIFKDKQRASCFGCGWYGDVIDMAAKYYNIPILEAAQRLCWDFGIMPGEAASPGLDEISQYRREKALTKALDLWREQQHLKLSAIYRIAHRVMEREGIDAVQETIIHWLPQIENILDRLEQGSEAEIAELWRARWEWTFLAG